MIEPSVLANAVMGKLYDVLTNGDDTVPKSADNFLAFMTPGVPIEPSELEFLTQGFTGVVKKAAVDTLREATAPTPTPTGGNVPTETPTPSGQVTPEQLNALMAQDSTRLYVEAENLARLLDFIPDVGTGKTDGFARMSVASNDGTLSDVYGYTLQMSQIMSAEIPDDLKQKIEKMRGLLRVVVKKKDLITDEEVETVEPSPLQKAYFEKMAAYDAAALEYNARRIDALTATDQRAVHDWAINANIYRNKVRAAMADWITNGYKDDYEKIAAFIDQVSRRDMGLLKQQYLEDLERARLTSAISGSDFFYTGLVPGNFASSTGWTRFGFSAGDFSRSRSTSSSSSEWEGHASGGWGGVVSFGGGASGSESKSEFHGKFDSSRTSISFEIAQVPIARPWFRTAFLTSKAWRFDQNNVTTKGNKLSDGGSPPQGMMPAYPTSAIFVRDLSLSMGESHELRDYMSQQKESSASGGGRVGFGGFSLGGGGSRSARSASSSSDWNYTFQNDTMRIPGMQLIGFKCHVLPKSPDPDPGITAWS